MKLTYCMLSDKGSRTNNEDRVGSYEKDGEYCFVLADGLGGHGNGEIASRTVVDSTINLFKTDGFNEFFMREAFEISQENINEIQYREQKPDDYKTTMVLLCVGDDCINWGHIGDSRLYYFKNKKKVLHTLDHSVPQTLVRMGEIEDKDIRNHPDRSHILRAMGNEWERPQYEIAEPVDCEAGMAFLMATDGFWELIEDEDMEKCFKRARTVNDWVSNMEKIVLKNGEGKNMDNYSAIAVWLNK